MQTLFLALTLQQIAHRELTFQGVFFGFDTVRSPFQLAGAAWRMSLKPEECTDITVQRFARAGRLVEVSSEGWSTSSPSSPEWRQLRVVLLWWYMSVCSYLSTHIWPFRVVLWLLFMSSEWYESHLPFPSTSPLLTTIVFESILFPFVMHSSSIPFCCLCPF